MTRREKTQLLDIVHDIHDHMPLFDEDDETPCSFRDAIERLYEFAGFGEKK